MKKPCAIYIGVAGEGYVHNYIENEDAAIKYAFEHFKQNKNKYIKKIW